MDTDLFGDRNAEQQAAHDKDNAKSRQFACYRLDCHFSLPWKWAPKSKIRIPPRHTSPTQNSSNEKVKLYVGGKGEAHAILEKRERGKAGTQRFPGTPIS